VNALVEAVSRSFSTRHLLGRKPAPSILLAVSGGLDSMVLLDVLHRLARTQHWKLAVAHFNHRLRGSESDADQEFVERASANRGLECATERGEVADAARRDGISIEMAARRLRHEFLARAAIRLRFPTVALAHHADDQLELFFVRLLRGAGSEGLSGMEWSSPSPANPRVRLIRPLLDQPKSALLEYARSKGLAFREDSSNRRSHILRNRIRRELVPLLKKRYQPATLRTVLRTMEILRTEEDFVQQAADRWVEGGRIEPFEKLHPALKRVVLRNELLELGIVPDFHLIEQLSLPGGRPVSVRPDFQVFRDASGQVLQQPSAAPDVNSTAGSNEVSVDLDAGKRRVVFDGLKVRWAIAPGVAGSGRLHDRGPDREQFDAERIGRTVILRHWRPGDRFRPIGMTKSVKLQDLFTNLKIPRLKRHQLVVASTATGELFWVEGLRIGESFKLDKHTRQRLKWHWSRK
jgi:tRNA(Ile)-lysidine synthase